MSDAQTDLRQQRRSDQESGHPGGQQSPQARPYGRWSALGWFALATALGGGCDLQTKAWAEETLSEVRRQSITVFDPWLDFSLVYNRGTAFSMIRDLGDGRWFFGVMALLVVAWLAYTVMHTRSSRVDAVALGAIAGGAIGNGYDRVFRMAPGGGTGVIDFIKVNYPWGGSWPTFNIADVLIAVGVILLLGHRLLKARAATPPDLRGEMTSS